MYDYWSDAWLMQKLRGYYSRVVDKITWANTLVWYTYMYVYDNKYIQVHSVLTCLRKHSYRTLIRTKTLKNGYKVG